MTLLEPFVVGAIVAYVMSPLAAYGIGIDPTLSMQYFCILMFAPLVLGFPTLLPAAVVYEAVFGGIPDLERLILALLGVAGSIFAFYGVSWWVHSPETAIRTAALALSSPFIGGVVASVIVGAALGLAYLSTMVFRMAKFAVTPAL